MTGTTHAGHRHTSHEHEHEFESAPGLPEPLPDGERVLWRGAPDWKVLARECFHVRKLAAYFAALVALRVGTVVVDGEPATTVLVAAAMALVLAGTALALVMLLAWLSARTTVYTITEKRIVMRIGIVLSVTFNLPFTKVESAGFHAQDGDHGDIALALDDATRIAWPHLWPHARPWHVARTQPSLRCIADAPAVARLLTDAWRAARPDVRLAPVALRPVSASPRPSAAIGALDTARAA